MAAPHHDENTPSKVKASFCFSSMRRNSCIVRDNEKRLRARRLRTDFFDGISFALLKIVANGGDTRMELLRLRLISPGSRVSSAGAPA